MSPRASHWVLLLTALAVALCLSPLPAALRAPGALALVCVLPGYALTAALFARLLEPTARLLLSLGMSITLTASAGYLLNWLPGGLETRAWALALGSVTVGATIVARRRRTRDAALHWGIGTFGRTHLLFGLAGLIVAAAFAIDYFSATAQHTSGFTQLWLLPSGSPGQESIRVGIENGEGKRMRYRLVLSVQDRQVRQWQLLVLQPDHTWNSVVTVPAGGGDLAATLYRLDAPATPYRRVLLRRPGTT